MALATRGPGFCQPDVVRHDWELAKELGLNITVHVAMDRFVATKMQIVRLRDMDLLYPNTTYVHASHFTDEEWALARDSGGNVSFAPQIEIQMGHGWAPGWLATQYNLPIGLSSDVATTAPSDQFTQMRSIFGSERGRKHIQAWEANLDGNTPSPDLITSRQVLSWATIDGARVAGLADRTGSLTPGKKADIVIIDGSAVNVAPVIDAVGAVVCAADVSNVKTVLVDGEILKRDFRLTAALDGPRKAVEASRDYLLAAFGDPEPGWLPRAVTA
jgi:cytosine/adenosine deaminase-related metal-dependent hydrolase